jgi:hypothetical protein
MVMALLLGFGDFLLATDIVLTRHQYLTYNDRRSALAGVVSTILLTKHLLFVGFSLSDENFHLINSVVRKLSPAAEAKTSTAFLLASNPLQSELYDNIQLVSMTEPGSNPPGALMGEAARLLEILLDYLNCWTITPTNHLLDPAFECLLSADEKALRLSLLELYCGLPDAVRTTAHGQKLSQFFQDFGAQTGISHATVNSYHRWLAELKKATAAPASASSASHPPS